MIMGMPGHFSFLAAHQHDARVVANTGVTFTLFLLCALSGTGAVQAAPQLNASGETNASAILLAQTASPEVTFWESVRDSDDPAEIEAYLEAYPNGQFASLARIRLEKLKQSAPKSVPSASPATDQAASSDQTPQGELGRQTLRIKVGEVAGSKRGLLGVHIADITDELANSLGFATARGALVTEVVRNGPAELAGIKPLDIIVEFDGRAIVQMRQLPQVAGSTPPGTEAGVVVFRLAQSVTELVDRLRASAEKGDADAAYSLGWLYAFGAGIAKDEAEAARWYRKAADQGGAEAMYNLGVMYANGQGVSKDATEAVKWYRQAAEKNKPRAMAALGATYEQGLGITKDEAEAARWYRKAADQGVSFAMYKLGLLYESGRGVPQDDAEAVIWLRKAVDDDNADALMGLGLMYESGRGVFQDNAQAVRLYRKGANLGHPGSMTSLGWMYESGRGVAKDEAESARWYRKAADLGEPRAMNNLGVMYARGSGVAKDEAEAVRWYRKAADLNEVTAAHNLGAMYRDGLGIAKDEAEAVRWFRKAADLGSVDALYSLGRAYQGDLGSRRIRASRRTGSSKPSRLTTNSP